MRVKRFVAATMQEAMAKVKNEMGNDAVILHTRHFKEGGFLGLFAKNYVEVTAALEQPKPNIQPVFQVAKPLVTWDENRNNLATDQCTPPVKTSSHFTYELKEMKNLMQEMVEQIGQVTQVPQFPRLGQYLYQRLSKQEVEDKLARKIVKATLQQVNLQPEYTPGQLEHIFLTNILKLLKKSKPIILGKKRQNKPLLCALVGPTGVGKTTTIAKLAAMYAIMERKNVALVTVDTYRIAAVEQLKTVGEIMGIPVRVVFTPQNLRECIGELVDKDIIFLDTAGRSHKNVMQITELKSFLEIANPDQTFLVLSSTSKYQDMLEIINTYLDLNVNRLIFTKLDETSSFGPIFNIACRNKLPLSYFTNGQNIPDDIEIADPVKLAQLLIKE